MKTTTPLGLVSLLVVVLLACPARGGASSLPATAGLPAVDQAIERLIADQQIAGAVTLVWRDGQLRRLAANGLSDRQTGTPMRTDALFWIASMTKPLTAIAPPGRWTPAPRRSRHALPSGICRAAPALGPARVPHHPAAADPHRRPRRTE